MWLSCAAAEVVTYEAFGAVGDGIHDDLPAIRKAHEYANKKGLPVRSDPRATYNLGRKALTAVIATDTDWSTSRFEINDTDVEDHKKGLFEVVSLLPAVELEIEQLRKDQERLDLSLDRDYHVTVFNHDIKRYIRRGLNQNKGSSQRDSFILKRDGLIIGPIDWDYDEVSEVIARPIDEATLTITGGVFNRTANQMQKVDGTYWYRNIQVKRSNTVLEGITHYVVGEGEYGQPYGGFISVSNCANVTLRDCFATGRKSYKIPSSSGRAKHIGSYDYFASGVVNFSMINCRMNHIMDRTRWGVIATDFCKNILIEKCELSRMDAHQGVSGTYTIRDSTLGHMGLNAIGRGRLLVENSTIKGGTLVNFRSDYGSTWEGTVEIRDSKWVLPAGAASSRSLFYIANNGEHDFGYPCYMPETISIRNLIVDDSAYEGALFYFSRPAAHNPAEATYPLVLTEELIISGVETTSGRAIELSPAGYLVDAIRVIDETERP